MKYLVSPITAERDYVPPAVFLAPYTEETRDEMLARMKQTEFLRELDGSVISIKHWAQMHTNWGVPDSPEDTDLLERKLNSHMYSEPGIVELPENFFKNNITWERRSVDCRTVHAREDSIRAIARMGGAIGRMGGVRIESYSFSRDLIEQTEA